MSDLRYTCTLVDAEVGAGELSITTKSLTYFNHLRVKVSYVVFHVIILELRVGLAPTSTVLPACVHKAGPACYYIHYHSTQSYTCGDVGHVKQNEVGSTQLRNATHLFVFMLTGISRSCQSTWGGCCRPAEPETDQERLPQPA